MKRNRKICITENMNKGRASLESLTAMLLLILLGAGLFSLAISTSSAYKKLYSSRESASELRVASSFVTTKIRQNDKTGCLAVKSDPISGKNALVVYEEIEGTTYATWVFHYNGYLMEALVLENEAPTVDLSQPVARIDEFEITYNDEEQGIYLKTGIEGSPYSRSFIKIRSGIRE